MCPDEATSAMVARDNKLMYMCPDEATSAMVARDNKLIKMT